MVFMVFLMHQPSLTAALQNKSHKTLQISDITTLIAMLHHHTQPCVRTE